jgi:hypothetical protein
MPLCVGAGGETTLAHEEAAVEGLRVDMAELTTFDDVLEDVDAAGAKDVDEL